jgi:hypothetical protein
MRILITNNALETRAGSETFVRDLALGLLARGHHPIVYSPHLGPIAEALRMATVPVVNDLSQVAEPPDLIHGHHLQETATALLRFPEAPGIFVVHDWHAWFDVPPKLPQIRRYVAVDDTRRDRLVSLHGIPAERVRVIGNSVDPLVFRPRAGLPDKPARALLFSSYVKHPRQYRDLLAACEGHGLELEVVGSGMHRSTDQPQLLLPGYDLVFAMGRSAMEAMATGNGVIIWGLEGLGGFVRQANFERLRACNFGRRTLRKASRTDLAQEIGAFDPLEAAWVRDHVRAVHTLDTMVSAYLSLYEDCLQEAAEAPVPLATTLVWASDLIRDSVPKAQVDSLLGRKASRSTRRIMALANVFPILAALALGELTWSLLPLMGDRPAWLQIGLAATLLVLFSLACYLRSWLRAKAGWFAQAGWMLFYGRSSLL